jgi:hypothetical protein
MRRGGGRADDLVWSTTAFSFCLTWRKLAMQRSFSVDYVFGLFLVFLVWDLPRAVDSRTNVPRVVGMEEFGREPGGDFAKSHIC